jgi:hypothetical protein
MEANRTLPLLRSENHPELSDDEVTNAVFGEGNYLKSAVKLGLSIPEKNADGPVVSWKLLWVGTGFDDRELLGHWMFRAQELGDTIPGLIVREIDDGGGIKSWDGMLVFADGETPSDSTPDVEVDWTGFAEAVESCDPVKVVWRSC